MTTSSHIGGTQPFGQALRALRLDRGLTPTELAKIMGCSRVQVHRIEASTNLTEASARRYADALGCSAELLLGRCRIPLAQYKTGLILLT